MSDSLDRIAANIHRYLGLRRFHDEQHRAQWQKLKDWQREHMLETYAELLPDPRRKALVEYFLDEIYRGLDLSDAAASVEKSLKLADRWLSSMRLIDLAMEFNALNAELDQGLTEILFETLGVTDIDQASYIAACQRLDRADDQFRTYRLISEFAEGLDAFTKNNTIYRSFRLGRVPIRMTRLRTLYDLIDRGFTIMRSLPDAEAQIQAIVRHEMAQLSRLHQGDPQPYFRFSPEG